jgi:hypothetical protein
MLRRSTGQRLSVEFICKSWPPVQPPGCNRKGSPRCWEGAKGDVLAVRGAECPQ